jgi:hypothetical protein
VSRIIKGALFMGLKMTCNLDSVGVAVNRVNEDTLATACEWIGLIC